MKVINFMKNKINNGSVILIMQFFFIGPTQKIIKTAIFGFFLKPL